MMVNARADQTVRVLAGSPLNPSNMDVDRVISAFGGFELFWDAEMGGSAALSGFTAEFVGTDDVLGGFTIFGGLTAPAFVDPFGTLENIQSEANGDLISADFTLGTAFSIVLDGGGPVIYTQDRAIFTGLLSDGAPGEIFTSPDPINGHLALGGDIGDDPVVAVSFDRSVTAVPEPSSAAILACIGVMSCIVRRRS